ncbi:MAG: H-NS histone family protein [Burkholderiaceae bacterium]|nr:H-NS histone family protein [Burkholderiaceae bacterium]MCD8518095.1 H-NS histone family protein [Burkholderiaceae bacterium]MCD8565103.1 H-NS histone family protein [Burkholderiaceae bacterium]
MPRQNYAALQAKIEKEIEKLKKQAQALQNKKRLPVIRSIIKSMKEYDITPEEITAAFGKRGASKTAAPKTTSGKRGPRGPVPIKYRHPETGDTWTGRGKAPRWVTDAEATGRKREEFLVQST